MGGQVTFPRRGIYLQMLMMRQVVQAEVVATAEDFKENILRNKCMVLRGLRKRERERERGILKGLLILEGL